MKSSRKKTQAIDLMRKNPTQTRAQQTVDTIYEATAQILNQEGEAGLSTNRIAEKSGFSIGTLYQYFPSKEAILLSLVERERSRAILQLKSILQQGVAQQLPAQDIVRLFIQSLIKSFASGRRIKRSLVKAAFRLDHTEPIVRSLNAMAEDIAASLLTLRDPQLRAPGEITLYVLTRAVMGVIRSASMEDYRKLGSQEFEDEIVRLTWGILRV
jgi:AcrR family transcriptional regulator